MSPSSSPPTPAHKAMPYIMPPTSASMAFRLPSPVASCATTITVRRMIPHATRSALSAVHAEPCHLATAIRQIASQDQQVALEECLERGCQMALRMEEKRPLITAQVALRIHRRSLHLWFQPFRLIHGFFPFSTADTSSGLAQTVGSLLRSSSTVGMDWASSRGLARDVGSSSQRRWLR